MKALRSVKRSVTARPATRCHTPEDSDPYKHLILKLFDEDGQFIVPRCLDVCIEVINDDLRPPQAQTAEGFQNALEAGGNPVNLTVRLC
jgi:hypothetical protein